MITRPLDLASRLRPEPRNFDWLFYVNVGLIALFFTLFGSRFVLAPGLGVEFRLPVMAGANAGARQTTHAITVMGSGQILTADGDRKLDQLDEWMTRQAKGVKNPVLLVRADAAVPLTVLAAISSAAKSAGFVEVVLAAGEQAAEKRGRR
jgi:biopolymer transport protein ExbD